MNLKVTLKQGTGTGFENYEYKTKEKLILKINE